MPQGYTQVIINKVVDRAASGLGFTACYLLGGENKKSKILTVVSTLLLINTVCLAGMSSNKRANPMQKTPNFAKYGTRLAVTIPRGDHNFNDYSAINNEAVLSTG